MNFWLNTWVNLPRRFLTVSFTLIFIAFGLAACQSGVVNPSRSLSFDQKIKINEHVFETVFLDDEPERAKGLMAVSRLGTQQGALFVYPKAQAVSFWMKNTFIPLDMLFFDKNRQLIKIIANIQPCAQSDCPRYSSASTRYVLELNAGEATRLNIRVGDYLML